ncbi:MAG: MgtC/SapB family protein [Candidatus Bipolaricaulota bacterium]|nr:MgtC/SapB family protein [Candidatus Bipolaricaulota bacterium]
MEEWTLLIRVLVAAVLAGVIGAERELHGRPAGLRTHLLVGTGAALVMVTFVLTARVLPSDGMWAQLVRVDPGRLAAGIITGIGFLGAGTIMRTGDWVFGLTTAASLWFVAALGIAAGEGLYIIAAGGMVIGLIVLTVMDRLEQRIPSAVLHQLVVETSAQAQEDVIAAVDRLRSDKTMRVRLTGWEVKDGKERVTLHFRIRHRGSVDIGSIASAISALDGVSSLRLE